jgi:hypothetical protein
MLSTKKPHKHFIRQGYLQLFMLMSPEDISKNFGEPHHCKYQKFEKFDKSQLKMVSPGLI